MSIIGSLLILSASVALTQELHENFYNARSLGMGDAFTATANDETAFWNNPAGVSRNRKHRTREFLHGYMPNIGLGINAKTRELYTAFSSEDDFATAVAGNDDLSQNQSYFMNTHMFPVVMWDYGPQAPGAAGIYLNSTVRMFVSEDAPEFAQVTSTSDVGFIKSVVFTDDMNLMSFGAQVRVVNRYALEDTIGLTELKDRQAVLNRFKENANKTTGLGVDVGALLTLPDFWYPSLGIAIYNLPTGCKEEYLNPHSKLRQTVCGTIYQGDIANPEALTVVDPMDLRVGLAISPRVTRDLTMRLGLDLHHLAIPVGTQTYGLTEVDPIKLTHAGFEIYRGNPLEQPTLAFRLGSYQGFVTSGFTIRNSWVSVDIATYGTNVSTSSRAVQDRRFISNFSFVF
jgi:hypothetical protein